jgi:hypothetical protein
MLPLDIFSGIPPVATERFDWLLAFCEGFRGYVLATLPWLLSEVAQMNGFKDMLIVARNRSGQCVAIPSHASELGSRLGISVSDALYQNIRRLAAGPSIDIPSAWGTFLALRRAAVDVALQNGLSDQDIAVRFGVTVRHLRQARRRRRELYKLEAI